MSTRERAGVLLGFALLTAYVSLHWFTLIADPPLWRWGACVVVAVVAAVALDALGLVRGRRVATVVGALLVAAAMLAVGLLATGIPARLLSPGAWGELRGELDAGLAGVSQLELPYDGPSEWTRLGILLAAPLTLTVATAIAFWPSRPGVALRRGFALALLVALYAVAVTWESPSGELAHGFGLLVCVAAFLWLGRFPASRALPAALAVAVAGLAALPAAARVDTTDPPINYAGWKLFGDERAASFDWNHSYGPLDWPQRGIELFEVRGADHPMYWKTAVLDDFDGAAWSRGDGVAGVAVEGSRLDDLGGVAAEVLAAEDRWIENVDISIVGLRSPELVTTGITRAVEGVATEPRAADGTTQVVGEGLVEGASYAVSSYVPNPSARLLKRRDDGRYPRGLERYTTLLLPQGLGLTGVAPEAAPVDPLVSVTAPLRGSRAADARPRFEPTPGALIANTPYARVRSLALRLTRNAHGNYQAVAAIERYLLDNYTYEQDVPDRRRPLPAFLFRDRTGYCQQFSGAMALMLRLAGIPSRVVSGFAPGQRDLDSGSYIVRDTDAHSWVEVWFPRVGWVTVDPTPSVAPARTEVALNLNAQANTAVTGLSRAFNIGESAPSGPINEIATTTESKGRGFPLARVAAFTAVLAGAALAVGYRRRRRYLLRPEGAAAQLRELERALPLIGGTFRPGTTLLGIERQLAAALGPAAASYPAALRSNRYRPGRPRRPGPRERRALRRALARGTGPRGRIRALLAIPPGGPGR